MNKRIISSILSLIIIILSFSVSAGAAEQKSLPSACGSQRVTLIVTLSSPSLLDHYNSNKEKFSDINELMLSDEGREQSEKILAGQEKIKKEIGSLAISADFSESRSFTAVTNGFTLNASSYDIETIREIDGVESVSVSETISDKKDPSGDEDPETEEQPQKEASLKTAEEETPDNDGQEADERDQKKEYETFGLSQKNEVNVVPAYEAGYSGKGILIGIIDSEMDLKHRAFSCAPDYITYDKDYIKLVHNTVKLGISHEYSIDDIFYNGKVIYAYDYGENDRKVGSKVSSHGTHVAGIAAGNNNGNDSVDYKGMAYDAQIAFFKISDQNNKLKDEYIIAALDDVIKINPDVINCSYGAVQYMMHDYEGRRLYERIIESGIAVVASAGNEAYNGIGAMSDGIPAWYSTYGSISLPSALEGSMSVAASVPEYKYTNIMTMTANGEKELDFDLVYANVEFEEVYGDAFGSVTKPYFQDESTIDYIYYDGIGTKDEFDQYDVDKKIVVVNESDLTPEMLIKNSAPYNCYAVIVIKSESGSKFTPNSIESDFFIYAVDHSEKEYFTEKPEGTIEIIVTDSKTEREEEHAKEIADFSSYGTRADLVLKPDITAPGQDIYSSITLGQMKTYELLSGTSMAAPCITGSYSILKQYVTEKGITKNLSPSMAEEYIYKLMMSTAKLVPFKSGTSEELYSSPRVQGSGMLDLGAAIETKAYLSVNVKRPKASLFDSESGSYSFEFEVSNTSSETLSFDMDHVIQTDSYKRNSDKKSSIDYINTLIPESIRDHSKVYFKVNGSKTRKITLEPYSSETVSVIIRLDSDFVQERSAVFINGFYVDGFVRLTSENNPELSIPFCGFCGKWSSGQIFPSDIMSDNTEFPCTKSTLSIASSFDNENSFSENAGRNIFNYDDLPKAIAFGRDSMRSYRKIPTDVFSNPSVLLPNIYILRDAMDFTVSISDKTGTLLLCQNFGDIPSYLNNSSSQCEYFISKNHSNQLEQYNSFVKNANEGEYLYTMTASTVGTDGNPERTESVSMKVHIDNTKPRIRDVYLEKTRDGKLYLNVEATDNLYLQGINFFSIEHDINGEISVKQEIFEEILQYYSESTKVSEKFAEYRYDKKTRKYYFRYSMTHFKDFLNKLKNQGSEVFKDDDVTIIFENEKDFSGIENNSFIIEAVDSAYLCGDEEIINLDAYGEASFHLIDKKGEPLSDIEVFMNGKRYFSDENGNVVVHNLPMGNNRLTIVSPYVLKNSESFYDFRLMESKYKYSKTIRLFKTPSTDSGTGQDKDKDKGKEPSVIDNFHTGDNTSNSVVLTVLSAMIVSSASVCLSARKRHSRKKR